MFVSIKSNQVNLYGKLFSQVSLHGRIVGQANLQGNLSKGISLTGVLSIPDEYSDYLEEYCPTPTVDGLTLSTRDKHMTKDLVIKPIPIYEVSNSYGGTTFIIGGTINVKRN